MATNSPAVSIPGIINTKPGQVPGQQLQQQQQPSLISRDILDDLSSRFIINVPVEERQNLIRICFQIELAHWFYLDFYCSAQKQKCGIKQFAFQLFQHIPFLQPHLAFVDRILEDWKQYKLSVPTYGAILLSEDLKHVLLVQSFWAKSSWGFPKGKINENEEPMHCAIREVYEETGYDIKNLIHPTQYIELVINYQYTRLYLVSGVPLSTVFAPRTRNEIKCCEWFPVDLLPVTKNDNFVKDNHSMNGNSFFMILPFVKRLKKWLEKVQKHKVKTGSTNSPVFGSGTGKQSTKYFENKSGNPANQPGSAQRQRQRHKSMGDLEQQQRSKSIGSQQQFAQKNTPHGDSYHQDITTGMAEMQLGSSVSAKKSNKKHHDGGGAVGTPAGAVTGAARTQTKRKLFDNVPASSSTAGDKQQGSVPGVVPASKDPLAMFDECKAWVGFKLDYGKFLQRIV